MLILARSLPEKNLVPLVVGSIINYFNNETSWCRPQPDTDNGRGGKSSLLTVPQDTLQSSTPTTSNE